MIRQAKADDERAAPGVPAVAALAVEDREEQEERDEEVVEREHLGADRVAPDARREREERSRDDAPAPRARSTRHGERQEARGRSVARGRQEVRPPGDGAMRDVHDEAAEERVERIPRRMDDAARRHRRRQLPTVAARHVRVQRQDVRDQRDERHRGRRKDLGAREPRRVRPLRPFARVVHARPTALPADSLIARP